MEEETIIKSEHRVEIPDNISLPDFMFSQFEGHREKIAFVNLHTGVSKTYGQVILEILDLTAGLHSEGIKAKDVVAISSTNCSEYFTVLMASIRLGATLTTANPSYTSEELIKQLTDSHAKIVFVQPEQLKIMEEVKRHVPNLEKIFLLSNSREHSHFATFEDLIYTGKTKFSVILPEMNPKEDTVLLLYSSGTTGLPKGVMLTHYNMIANLYQSTKWLTCCMRFQNFSPKPNSTNKQSVSNKSMFCTLLWPLIHGSTVLISPTFNLEFFLSSASKYKATLFYLPPPVLVLLSKSPLVKEHDLSSVRAIYVGAAAVPHQEAKSVMKNLGGNPMILQAYGMTELSPVCHMMEATEESREKLNSIGKLVPSTECKVVHPETGKCCKVGEHGEIWIRGPQVMKGYLNNPLANQQTILPDGFLKTGDIGYYDDQHYFYVVDRLKELIKVRGFQVAPAELEGLILTHPAVQDVVVIGIPDSYSGELPRAYVVKKPRKSVTEDEIKDHIKGHVARYKQLAGGVSFVEELPKTASGKPLRRVLTERAKLELAKTKSKL